MPAHQKVTDEQIIQATKNSTSMREAAESLKINLTTFKDRAVKLGVYRPNQGRKNIERSKEEYHSRRIIPLDQILEGKFPLYQTHKLRLRLFKDKIKERKCEICGISQWNGVQLSLILDHINGINNDHRLENLRIVCPNCDSLLPTFCGRNKRLKSLI